jgi:hypothetical protein
MVEARRVRCGGSPRVTTMPRLAFLLLAPLLAAPGLARAQTTLTDNEHRLMEIHSLLLDLPPVQAPAVLSPRQLAVSLEAVLVPFISGDAPPYHDITASDHSRVFPRPRVQLGLPGPGDFRAFVGASYVPPIEFRGVRTHYFAAEGGLGLTPGRWLLGARLHALVAEVHTSVTDPNTTDPLKTFEYGADGSAGYRVGDGPFQVQPYGGLGLVTFHSHFHVTVDGTNLTRDHTNAVFFGGLRCELGPRWETVAEVVSYPDRLTHVDLRLGYRFGG